MTTKPLKQQLLQNTLKQLGSIAPKACAHWAYREWFRTRRSKPRPEETDILRQAQQHTVNSAQGPIHYWTYEPTAATNSNDYVLLLHGWNGRGSQFYALITQLRQAGLRCIALDAPGHGASPGKQSSLFAFADALAAVLATQETSSKGGHWLGLITHSFGGLVAGYALQNPRILAGHTPKHLITIACPVSVAHLLNAFIDNTQLPRGAAQHLTHKLDQYLKQQLGEANWDAFHIGQQRQALPPSLLLCHDQNDLLVPIEHSACQHPAMAKDERLITQHQGHFRILRNPELLQRCLQRLSADQ